MLTSPQPASLGRVISVRGSQARVGLVTTSQINDSNVRATVGQFFGIRTATTIIVAMITEVSRENLPPTDNYIAIARSTCWVRSPSARPAASNAASRAIRPSATWWTC